mmetsp:Transcript_36291/g.72168  ORF Transcript_36291/g.72168 Transcript_36291/m.72168 type:complete len:102 (+) Transcript_36291:557-862(+)
MERAAEDFNVRTQESSRRSRRATQESVGTVDSREGSGDESWGDEHHAAAWQEPSRGAGWWMVRSMMRRQTIKDDKQSLAAAIEERTAKLRRNYVTLSGVQF